MIVPVFVKRLGAVRQFLLPMHLQLRHQLAEICLRTLRVGIQYSFTVFVRALPVPVLQEHKRPLEQRGDIGAGGVHLRRFFDDGVRLVRFRQLLDATDQILHKAQLGHILRLQMGKFLRQIVRIHIPIGRDQHFLRPVFNQRQISAPLIFHPYGIKIFRSSPQHHHHLCAVQRGEYVRLIGCPQLILQRDAGEEHLEALLRQLVVQVVGQHAVRRPTAVVVRLLVADEHVEGFFLAGYFQNPFLNVVDSFGLRFIDRPLGAVRVGNGLLVVLVRKNRSELGAVDRRHTLMSGRILHVFDAVPAEHQRPIGFGVGAVLVENLLVYRHGLVVLVVAAEVVGPVVQVGPPIAVQPWQRLLRPAILALGDAHPFLNLQIPAAHFTFKQWHG